MSYTTLLAAAALASLPMVSSAATITDGGSTTIASGQVPDLFYGFNVDPDDADMEFTHTFTLADGGSATAEVSLVPFLASLFNGLALSWSGGTAVAFDASGDASATALFGAGDSQTMTISWTSVAKGVPDFDGIVTVEVAAVPVPASLLLLGTAIGGLGLARRRKS